jgi:hypothetical protein
MKLVGNPFPVAHSPQQLAVQGTVAYVTMFDAVQLESIDISDPANLRSLHILPLATEEFKKEPLLLMLDSGLTEIHGRHLYTPLPSSGNLIDHALRVASDVSMGVAEDDRFRVAT